MAIGQVVGFAADLARHSSAPALVTSASEVSYAELDHLVAADVERLGPARRLVLLAMSPTVECVVAYLAALRAGHPVIATDAHRPDLLAELRRRFSPDLLIDADGWHERHRVPAHELHPDLALLLSTSGSTGSPKLVRLSASNLQANAQAIASYLDLRPSDRAATSLPLGYCYGLSVLNSHLAVGGSIVLTDRSVIDEDFWDLARRTGITGFAGVPHTFALLGRQSHPWYATPTLRYVTQAGGRLAPDEVRRLAEVGVHHGWQMVVMYGQTEATARMAYLPPALALTHPHCIGRAVPGGHFRLDAPDDQGVGELVYRGPNVMLGYAENPAALARGAEFAELHTGDLARHCAPPPGAAGGSDDGGLYEIVGRRSRFAKILGQRIDLDRVQEAVTAVGGEAACTSDDQRLVVTVTSGDPGVVRRRVATLTGLPAGLVVVRQWDALPRLANGKLDLVALATAAEATDGTSGSNADTGEVGCTATEAALAGLRHDYAEVLGYEQVAPSATFAGLGGDSLSFVEMSVRLEERLGAVPADWPDRTIAELASLARHEAGAGRVAVTTVRRVPAQVSDATPPTTSTAATAAGSGPVRSGSRSRRSSILPAVGTTRPRQSPRSARPLAHLETSVVLRAVAITLVVVAHLELWTVRGGAHLLLVVAGFTFARFPLAAVRRADSVRPLVGAIVRTAVPAVAFIAVLVALDQRYSVANIVLLNHVFGPSQWTAAWNFWFLETLVTILLACALLLWIPAVRRWERSHTLALPVLILGAGLLVRYDAFGWSDVPLRFGRPGLVFWLFVLGWVAQRVSTLNGRLLLSAVTVVALVGYFPGEPIRVLIVQVGVLLLVWRAAVPVPRVMVGVVRRLAAGSLWIYLTHWVTWPALLALHLPRGVVVVGCLAVGVVAARAMVRVQSLAVREVRPLLVAASAAPRRPASVVPLTEHAAVR